MAAEFDRALTRFITTCAHVRAVHDLITKWRLELTGGYVLDLFFNETLSKYSYALVQSNARVMGWDNAPHHPGLLNNFPHHVHLADGQVEPSTLTGDAGHDLEEIRLEIEAFLGQQTLRR